MWEPESKPLTLQDIREASTNYLRFVIKCGEADAYIISMMETELQMRTQRRRIN